MTNRPTVLDGNTPSPAAPPGSSSVMVWADTDRALMAGLLARFGIAVFESGPGRAIPGSYWGESEAGLLGGGLHVRSDTPLHSALHEACHWICMDGARRAVLDTDAGGDYAEEDAVCYLQILLADTIPGCGRERMCADMDAWGYTFRLGSAGAWFGDDAQDARDWLCHHRLIDRDDSPTWQVRV